jgi:predicted peptidase
MAALGATSSEFEGVDHNAWDAAYAMEELAEWLFLQNRSQGGRENESPS